KVALETVEENETIIKYKPASDFDCLIACRDVLDHLIGLEKLNECMVYVWKNSDASNYWLAEYLLWQDRFPKHISVAINKTYQLKHADYKKGFYCSGCISSKSEKTS